MPPVVHLNTTRRPLSTAKGDPLPPIGLQCECPPMLKWLRKDTAAKAIAIAILWIIVLVIPPIRAHLADFQTFYGAFFGLLGLGAIAFLNADLNRERDDRSQARRRATIAAAINAQIEVVLNQLRSIADETNEEAKKQKRQKGLLFPDGLMTRMNEEVGIFGAKLGPPISVWASSVVQPQAASTDKNLDVIRETGSAIVEVLSAIIEHDGELPDADRILLFEQAVKLAYGKYQGKVPTTKSDD